MTKFSTIRQIHHQTANNLVLNGRGSDKQNSFEVVENAILRTVAYADIFDYPLTLFEISRNLIGITAPLQTIKTILQTGRYTGTLLGQESGYVFIAPRKNVIRTRQRRSEISATKWPKAIHYARMIASLPFVRMVAVTGALAVDNLDEEGDLDYLIVTSPGRLWLCRAMVITLVRWAALFGDVICPNYFLSTRALVFDERNLYAAHELTQMVPVSGWETYELIRSINQWSNHYLPNAAGYPPRAKKLLTQNGNRTPRYDFVQFYSEKLLRGPALNRLEDWEMNRKIRKFASAPTDRQETAFSQDWCKGHFDGHANHTLKAFEERINKLGIENP